MQATSYTSLKHPDANYIDLRRLQVSDLGDGPEFVESWKAELVVRPVFNAAHGARLLAERVNELLAAGWQRA